MRLPIIKHVVKFVEDNDEDWVNETIELLEYMADAKGVKEKELEVIGELLSNLYGAIEVVKEIKRGASQNEALNSFMKRVTESIES